MRSSQEDLITRNNKRLIRVWKIVLVTLCFVVYWAWFQSHPTNVDNSVICGVNSVYSCNVYHGLAKISLSLTVFFVGLIILQHCCSKVWTVVWSIGCIVILSAAVCAFIYMPNSIIHNFQTIIPVVSGIWLVYQSFIVVHLAHYFHYCVVNWRFNSYLSWCSSFCTISPSLVLQVYASIAVLVNISLLNCFNLQYDYFQSQLILTNSQQINSGLLTLLSASLYVNIVLSLLSILPQFSKGLITVNSLVLYQLLMFSLLIPLDNSPLLQFLRTVFNAVSAISVCYMVMERQHSIQIIQNILQCRKNPLNIVSDCPDCTNNCGIMNQLYGYCTKLSSYILRINPNNNNNEEIYELVSNFSDEGEVSSGWTTHLRNLYASPSTSVESAENDDEIDPSCMENEFTAETSLLRQHRGTSNASNSSNNNPSSLNNRMERNASFNDALQLKDSNNNIPATLNSNNSGSASNVNTNRKLSVSSGVIVDANYNSINSPSGSSSSGMKSFDIENNYQEQSYSGSACCCSCCPSSGCQLCCVFPVSRSSTARNSPNYFTSLLLLTMEKSTMFHLSLIGLLCFVCMLVTDFAAPDGTTLNIFNTETSEAVYTQIRITFCSILIGIVAVWFFYVLSLLSSYKIYTRYQEAKTRLYESRLVQNHPTRTSSIL